MKRALQVFLVLFSLVPLFFSVQGLLFGAEDVSPSMDSQFRFLSGIYLVLVVLLWRVIIRIEEEGTLFAFVMLALFVGGLGRVISLLDVGPPTPDVQFGMGVELGAPPLLVFWQRAVAKRGRRQTE